MSHEIEQDLKEDQNVSTNQLDSSSVCSDGVDSVNSDWQITDGDDVWGHIEGGLFGDLEELDSFTIRGADEGGSRLLDVHETSHNTTRDHLSHARRGRKGVESGFADDFEGVEREAWDMLYERVRHSFITASPKAKREQALRWCMTIEDDKSDVEGSYEECCQALGVRSDVLLLRLHYEWYLKGTVFEDDFGFFCRLVPERIASEVIYYGGQAMLGVASQIWKQPGKQVMDCISKDFNLFNDIEQMIRLGYFAEKAGGLYLIGRNPLLKDGKIPWNKLF